jgi:chorismate mutase
MQIQMALSFMIHHFAKQMRELNSQVQGTERKSESVKRLLEYLIKAIAQAVDFDDSVISQYLKSRTQHIKFLTTIAAFKENSQNQVTEKSQLEELLNEFRTQFNKNKDMLLILEIDAYRGTKSPVAR